MNPRILQRMQRIADEHKEAIDSLTDKQVEAVTRLLLTTLLVPDELKQTACGHRWLLGVFLMEAEDDKAVPMPTMWSDDDPLKALQ